MSTTASVLFVVTDAAVITAVIIFDPVGRLMSRHYQKREQK